MGMYNGLSGAGFGRCQTRSGTLSSKFTGVCGLPLEILDATSIEIEAGSAEG